MVWDDATHAFKWITWRSTGPGWLSTVGVFFLFSASVQQKNKEFYCQPGSLAIGNVFPTFSFGQLNLAGWPQAVEQEEDEEGRD